MNKDIIGDDGEREWLCSHGIGHPYPDTTNGIHTCDGCCAHGHHINQDGDFQSDKYPELAPNKIVLSFKDPAAQQALLVFCEETDDRELANDILNVLEEKFGL